MAFAIQTSKSNMDAPPSGEPRVNLDSLAAQNLKLWWPGESKRLAYPQVGGAEFVDNDATAIADPEPLADARQKVYSFDANRSLAIPSTYSYIGDVPGQAFTMQCWIWPPSNQYTWILAKAWAATHVASYARYSMILQTDGRLTTLYGPSIQVGDANEVAFGEASHIASTYDGAFIRAYVNGYEVNTPLAKTGDLGSSAFEFLIGSNANGTENFIGQIWGAQVHDRVMSQEELWHSAHGGRFDLYAKPAVTYFLPVAAAPGGGAAKNSLSLMGMGI